MKGISVRLSNRFRPPIEQLAEEEGRSLTNAVQWLLDRALAQRALEHATVARGRSSANRIASQDSIAA